MPFLQVLTRCYRRPHMLMRNIASLCAQTCDDWEQTFLVDTVGRGVGWSYLNMAAHASLLRGDYVWVLDDDDECTRPLLVAELQFIAAEHNPDVIMLRMDHGPRGVLPSYRWMATPAQGDIGCSAYVVRRELWALHAGQWSDQYAGDYDFITAVFADDPEVYWHDVIASQVQRISLGEPEQWPT